jgi:glycosyltransferase involved in cell wall biosynthesis
MRILFIAMSDSIHTTRWINQVEGQGWDIHLFPSIDIGQVNPYLMNTTVHHSFYGKQNVHSKTTRIKGIPVIVPSISQYAAYACRAALQHTRWHNYRSGQLRRLIRRLKPDIIHSLEFQSGGYLVSDVKKSYDGQFPSWIATNWGSDIYLFGRLSEHAGKIKDVLEKCDYYSCECRRDVMLARQLGFKGKVLPVLPNTGGFDLERTAQFRQPGAVSARRLILLKGYQHWAGRALVGLRALALCADSLKGYRIAIPLASDDVKIAAELVSQDTGIPIEIIPYCSHDDMLRRYGQARISIGLSISDAISTSLLEAMVMGAFPIQSCTACSDEWIVDGETGFIVPPEDPEIIAAAIRKAVSDDNLVNRAAQLNAKVAQERLDQATIRPQVIEMYKKIAAETEKKRK